MAEKENPAALGGAYRGIVKTAEPCVSNSQPTMLEALKQDALFDPKVVQELFSTPGERHVPDAYVLPVIVRLGGFVLWMPMCPFCEMEHTHGHGLTKFSDYSHPRQIVQAGEGFRSPHCGQFGWPVNYNDMAGNYRLVWRGEAAQFAPDALSPSGRPSRAAKETARRLEACGVLVSYRQIVSAIPSKIWRWR